MTKPTEPTNEEREDRRAEWLAWFRDQRRERDDRRFAGLVESLTLSARASIDPKWGKAKRHLRRRKIDTDIRNLQELWTSRYDNEAMDGTRLAQS